VISTKNVYLEEVYDGFWQTLFDTSATLSAGEFLPLWLCFAVVVVFAVLGMMFAYISFSKSIK